MEVENNFRPEEIEARGALCVECLGAVGADGEAVLDRVGATLCRACASEFYAPCAGCGGLVARDEALTRPAGDGAPLCAECFAAGAGAEGPPAGDDEVRALVAQFVALHAEKKRLDDRLDELKERIKLAARARPRVAGAVVLRAGDDAGVRCSYTVKTTWDAERLSAVEGMVGRAEFDRLFERKTTFTPVREALEEFLAGADAALAAAREAVRAAAQQTEVTTLNVVAQKKKK